MKFFKLLGTEKLFSSEDLLFLKLDKKMPFQQLPYWIKNHLLHFQMLETHKFWCALLFAPIWVAFQCHISELTRDGFAYVTVPSMISSEELDKDQHKLTCHTSTTLCTVESFASKSRSSQTSHQSISTSERINKYSIHLFKRPLFQT